MKRFIGIGFLFLYLSVATELHQLLRLPVFFEHYQEHQSINPGISITEFIVLHYFRSDVRDQESARDEQLPFRSQDCAELALSSMIVPDIFSPLSTQPQRVVKNSIAYAAQFYTSNFQWGIWQPPKQL